MTTVGEKKRRKRERRKMDEFDLAPTPRRQKSGNWSEAGKRDQSDPRNIVLDARCRMAGKPATRANRRQVSDPISGSPIGLACRAALEPEAAMEAWDAWRGYDGIMRRFDIVMDRSSSPTTANLASPPDASEIGPDAPPPDHRTEDERISDAKAAHERVTTALARLNLRERNLIEDSRFAPPEAWWDAATATVTRKGKELARALYEFADIAD